MALPTSGPISMGDINVELGNPREDPNTYLAGGVSPFVGSLFGQASSSVNKIAPHAISEFYGYVDLRYRFENYVVFNTATQLAYNISNNDGDGQADKITFQMKTYGDGNAGYSYWQNFVQGSTGSQLVFTNEGGAAINAMKIYQSANSSGPWTLRSSGPSFGVIASVQNANGLYFLLEIEKEDGSENTLYTVDVSLYGIK